MPAEYKLACEHLVYYSPPPNDGDLLYCMRCQDYRMLWYPPTWWIKCTSPAIGDRACRMARGYGGTTEDEAQAKRVAIKHVARFTTHRVAVFYGEQCMAEVVAEVPPASGSLEDRYHNVTL